MPIMLRNLRILRSPDSGSGGMPFFCAPPAPGLALVGAIVRAGDWIDQITPIFAELLEDGTLGPTLNGPAFGGHSGDLRELACAPGHVVTGIQIRSGHYVDAIRLQQTRWDGSLVAAESSWTSFCGGGGGAELAEWLAEPVGSAAIVGLIGRAGSYVDRLGVVTAEAIRVPGMSVAKGGGRATRSATG